MDFIRIEPKQVRLKTPIATKLGQELDAQKASSRPLKLVRMKIAAIPARLLFKKLVNRLHTQLE
jgi:hypothetical protein